MVNGTFIAISFHFSMLTPLLQFKKLYHIIHVIQSVSSWDWDDKTGASITVNTASSWDDYVKKHPKAKPFRNSGWMHFNKVTLIMPATPAGAHVFHPTARVSTPDDVNDHPSSPDPTPPPVSSDPQDGEDPGHDEVSNAITFFSMCLSKIL